jgi:hypothetical protein
MVVQFGRGLGAGMSVQNLDRVLVDVCRLLAWRMDLRMRMFVRVGMFVDVRMYDAVGVRMFVRVGVRMNVGVRVIVFDLIRHGVFLQATGEKVGRDGCGKAAIASRKLLYSMRRGNGESTDITEARVVIRAAPEPSG